MTLVEVVDEMKAIIEELILPRRGRVLAVVLTCLALVLGNTKVRGDIMPTAQEYRQFADECVRSANDAELSETTASLLALAQSWRIAALEIESGVTMFRRREIGYRCCRNIP